jgi:hypothetical protein
MEAVAWKSITRFRLRTLLLAFTVASVGLGIYTNRARSQRRSVVAIQKYGGWVRYDFQFPSGDYSYKGFDAKARSWIPQWCLDQVGVDMFHNVVQVNLNYSEDSGIRQENHNPSDEALGYLAALPHLRVLLLSDTQASDDSMSNLGRLQKLQYLYMWDVSNVTDAGVAHLRGHRTLRYVHLSSSRITDKSLEVFGKMPQLEGLSLQYNRFTDEGLGHVAQLTNLTSLWVCGPEGREPSSITDAGLRQLEGLNKLTKLGIRNTKVTPAGVAAFTKAVPGCHIAQ